MLTFILTYLLFNNNKYYDWVIYNNFLGVLHIILFFIAFLLDMLTMFSIYNYLVNTNIT